LRTLATSSRGSGGGPLGACSRLNPSNCLRSSEYSLRAWSRSWVRKTSSFVLVTPSGSLISCDARWAGFSLSALSSASASSRSRAICASSSLGEKFVGNAELLAHLVDVAECVVAFLDGLREFLVEQRHLLPDAGEVVVARGERIGQPGKSGVFVNRAEIRFFLFRLGFGSADGFR